MQITKEKVSDLTLGTIALFLRIWESPARTAFAYEKGSGNMAKVLEANGLIEKCGRVGKNFQWRANQNVEKDVLNYMRELLRISGPENVFAARVEELEKRVNYLEVNLKGGKNESNNQ